MTKLEQSKLTGNPLRNSREPALFIAKRQVPQSNVVEIDFAGNCRGPVLVRSNGAHRLIGRKGRAALAKRRAVDGAFLTVAMAAMALIWWSAR